MKSLSCLAAAATCVLLTHTASAEVKLGEVGGWEAYTTGRVNAFLTFANGDGFPAPPAGSGRTYLAGGGLRTDTDRIPELDAAGMPRMDRAGSLSKWRVRSGYIPNVLGLGVRSQPAEDLKLSAFVALWGTIESSGARKYFPVQADFHEAYLKMEGSWGSVTAGRTLSLFSRGITEVETMYGHGYGVGYHPSTDNLGPTGGLVGFGVLAATYNPGVYYTTPSLGGLAINLGIYDPIKLGNEWVRTETPRPELEITYDMDSGDFKLHVFGNGAYQKLYKENNTKEAESMYGLGGGLRLEVGAFHLGGGGHYGRGLGMFYAFEGFGGTGATLIGPTIGLDPVSMQELNKPNELRTFDGFSAFAQYAHDDFDINLGFGQSRAHQLAVDKLPSRVESLIKTQTGISLGFVYHVSKNLHLDADFMRAMFRWYKGDKQDVNFFNAGATIDW